MPQKLDPRRRRAAVLGGSAAALSTSTSLLLQHGHPVFGLVVLAIAFGILIYALVEVVRFRRDCRRAS